MRFTLEAGGEGVEERERRRDWWQEVSRERGEGGRMKVSSGEEGSSTREFMKRVRWSGLEESSVRKRGVWDRN